MNFDLSKDEYGNICIRRIGEDALHPFLQVSMWLLLGVMDAKKVFRRQALKVPIARKLTS